MKHIGISSLPLWLFIKGTKEPIRGRSNANGNLIDAEVVQLKNGGETCDYEKKIDLSQVCDMKYRIGWDGIDEEDKYYGKIKIK